MPAVVLAFPSNQKSRTESLAFKRQGRSQRIRNSSTDLYGGATFANRTKDFLAVRSGIRAGTVDEVEVPGPETLAGFSTYGARGASSGFTADSVDAALDAVGDPPAYPDGRGFHGPIKAAFSAAIREDGSAVDQEALLEAIDAVLHERGHTRPPEYIEARRQDARRWLAWWVRIATDNEARQPAAAPAGPHFRRPHLAGETASKRLRRVVRAWFDRVEHHLAVQTGSTSERGGSS